MTHTYIRAAMFMFASTLISFEEQHSVSAKKTLHVGGLFELSKHWWSVYTNFFPTVVEYAFDIIRNRSDILEDYELKLVVKDTEGKNGLAARRFHELLLEEPPKVAIIGPGLSDELTITGQMAPFYNVPVLSYAATTASTADKELFPTLFKVTQIMSALNPLRLAMLKFFGWSRVGTLFTQDDMTESQMNLFHDLLQENNMTLVTSAVISETTGIEPVIRRFKQFDVRIIFGAFRSSIAPDIFCEAYHQGLYGDSHVWILAGPYMYANWISRIPDTRVMTCSRHELIVASDGHFTMNYGKISTTDTPTEMGPRPSEIMDLFKEMVSETPYKLSSFCGLVFDTAIALAYGLNNSIGHLKTHGLELDNYSYTDTYLDAILKGLHEITFMGVSGPVAFDSEGRRIGITYMQQNFNDTRKDVAIYDSISDNLTWLVPTESLWEDGTVPEDRFTYEVYPSRTSPVAFGIIATICTLGCVVAFGFLGFNIHNRNKRFIKMSSPTLNNIIICGCLLMYMVVYLKAADYHNLVNNSVTGKLCMIRTWIMSLGFTTLFGTLFSKTYRVYAIFREEIKQKRSIRDYHLFGMVGIMLVADCIVLIPWTIVHPLERKLMVENTKDDMNHNVIYSEVYSFCHHDKENYWFASVYIYKGLLLAFGTFLAWETRKVKVAALNDSKYIGFCIYNVVIVCVFGVPLEHALPVDQKTSTFLLESCLNIYSTTACLCILFIPKVSVYIYNVVIVLVFEHALPVDQKTSTFLLESCLNIYSTTACLCILFIPKIRARNKVHGKFLISQDPVASGSGESKSTNVTQRIEVLNTSSCSKRAEDLQTENTNLRMKIASDAIAMAKLKKRVLEKTGNVHFYKSGSDYVVFKSDSLDVQQQKKVVNSKLNDMELASATSMA